MHLDVAHEKRSSHRHYNYHHFEKTILKKEKMGLFVAICAIALTAGCQPGPAGAMAASTRGAENDPPVPNLFNVSTKK